MAVRPNARSGDTNQNAVKRYANPATQLSRKSRQLIPLTCTCSNSPQSCQRPEKAFWPFNLCVKPYCIRRGRMPAILPAPSCGRLGFPILMDSGFCLTDGEQIGSVRRDGRSNCPRIQVAHDEQYHQEPDLTETPGRPPVTAHTPTRLAAAPRSRPRRAIRPHFRRFPRRGPTPAQDRNPSRRSLRLIPIRHLRRSRSRFRRDFCLLRRVFQFCRRAAGGR